MLSKGVGRILGSSLEIFSKAQLTAKRIAGLDCLGLLPFSLPDCPSRSEQISHGRRRYKNTAVIIRENNITFSHIEIAKARRTKC